MVGLILTVLLLANNFLYNDPTADRLIRQTLQNTYSMKIEEARSAAKSLQELFPDHPAGYTLMAETYWWEAQSDPGNSAISDKYYAAHDLAVEKGESALKSSKYPKLEITAYIASAHGSYARFKVTQEQAFFGALRAGLRAHRYAEEVYEMDKNYFDIYVGIGAFNYFTGSLPGVIKPFAWLIGARGDRDLGLQQLKTAMTKARYSQTEARIVYYTAMLEEKNWPEAWSTLERLRKDYPDNYVLYVWVTDWYRQQRRNLAGAEYFEKVYSEEIKRSPVLAKYALLEKVQLQDAEGREEEALRTLSRLKAIPGGDAALTRRVQAVERSLGN